MYGLSIANRELERKSHRERCSEGERERRDRVRERMRVRKRHREK